MKERIQNYLPAECPWRDTLLWFETIGSTNTEAKHLAMQGAPHGTVLIAGHQTGGRGRLGRTFQSPAGKGVYLSVILRPDCPPEQLMHLTCAAAVAMCDAITDAAGFRPGIKWTNDLVYQKKKLGGILTELSVDHASGKVEYAVIGIGINCTQNPGDFHPDIRDMATSLSAVRKSPVEPAVLAAAMVHRLFEMDQQLAARNAILDRYKKDCMTLGQQIVLLRGDEKLYGTALDIDPQGALVVRFADGHIGTVASGEVSVRGMYGYL